VKTIGNILWLIFAGVWLAIGYIVGGIVMCLTIIGIPFGIQAFKLAGFALWPFGREIERKPDAGGIFESIFNVIWLILSGWEIFLAAVLGGILLCITIIGIPFGIQAFKLGALALWPFGREIVEDRPA
jgi:uncharacterized membrane protein YccF (DUF307 family)